MDFLRINTHIYRQLFVDGSDHPKDLKPTFYGDSRGHGEGDTLVVDTIDLNDISWMDGRGGSPRWSNSRSFLRMAEPETARFLRPATTPSMKRSAS